MNKIKLNSRQLRESQPKKSEVSKVKRRDIFIICDNILDTFNIGSIFRLADAVAVKKIYLCGKGDIPPNERIAKAAVGTDKWVEWEHASSAVEAISKIKNQISKVKVIAIEQGKNTVDYRKVEYKEPIVFVVGHETTGVSRDAIKAADYCVELPMYGVNRSLNVMVSLAIVLYQIKAK